MSTEVDHFFREILKLNLTPNQVYVLNALYHSSSPILANVRMEIRGLQADGYLTGNMEITKKGKAVIASLTKYFNRNSTKAKKEKTVADADLRYIEKYRALFPTGLLPTGKVSRQPVRELQEKFNWFFLTYKDYNWDLILQATASYLDDFETRDYEFMRSSASFIVKTDSLTKLTTSELANWCELILSTGTQPDLPPDKT